MAKLNPAGSALVYSTYLGGSDMTRATALRWTRQATPTSRATLIDRLPYRQPAASQLRQLCRHNGDAFVAKLNPAGSALVYSTYLGGSNYDMG